MTPTPFDATDRLLLAANRAAVYGVVSRWLVHEIRNPLQAVSLVTEIVTAEGGEPLDRTLAVTLRHSVQQLSASFGVLDEILRPILATVEIEPVVVGDVLSGVERLYAANNTPGPVTAPDTAGTPAIAVHAPDLQLVLLNLLQNAKEAVGMRQEAQISLDVAVRDGHLEIGVEDNGPGPDASMRDRLFEPFVTTKTQTGLTGIGLAVAKRLMERNGGTVRHVPTATGARFVVDVALWGPPGR